MRWPRAMLAYAVDLVEQDGTRLLEQSKMTTLLGIVKKLPPDLVVGRLGSNWSSPGRTSCCNVRRRPTSRWTASRRPWLARTSPK